MLYFCCEKNRRAAVQKNALEKPTGYLNGIDFIEVDDDPNDTIDQRQRRLIVRFINKLESPPLTAANFHIEGGERIRGIEVVDVTSVGDDPRCLEIEVDRPGDFSIYTLQIVSGPEDFSSPDNIDPMLAEIDFSFKAACPSEFDCQEKRTCPEEPIKSPEINYLAKDYESFRRLMLDRMALLLPQWNERSPADLGITLVELLSHVGDQLSYQQDAVGTEAYLHTARKRVSVRRHARLVDYVMHDGCNARTWVQVKVGVDHVKAVKSETKFMTAIAGQSKARVVMDPLSQDYTSSLLRGPIVFEACEDKTFFKDQNEMHFYTWGDTRCCIPKGATGATLKKHLPSLKKHDVLIFEEVKGPYTDQPADADPARRHAVRLTNVICHDNGNRLTDPLTGQEITQIEWAVDDSLPLPLCISSRTNREHGGRLIDDVSVALGNIVLCDHGLSGIDEELGAVPDGLPTSVLTGDSDRCLEEAPLVLAPRFRPALQKRPLTWAAPYNLAASAAKAMLWSMTDVRPAIELSGGLWQYRQDLLDSDKDDSHFVIETENDGTAYLRFGDNTHGKRPGSGMKFKATYRIGNGVAGNIGAESLRHIVTGQSDILGIRNPLPARGGVDPESMDEVRKRAPYAFRIQERAVTPEDYAEVTERRDGIQKAAATMRWTGSWHTVFLTVDRMDGLDVDSRFEDDTRMHVERYRMAGHDLEVNAPLYIPLEIEMRVCVKPEYFRSDVKQELLAIFSNQSFADGRRGVFHPDNFTFGQTVHLSPLYAAAQKVAGVDSVHITIFQRQGQPDPAALQDGRLKLNRMEIARLDNDRNYPERGVFRLEIGGGK